MPWWLRQVLTAAAAIAVPIAVALAFIPVRARTPNTTVALALAVVVVAIAALTTRGPGVLAAVAAAASFDVWFTRPYRSFTIARAQDVETVVLLLAVGLLVGQVGSRSRRHRLDAVLASHNLARVHAVAEMVAAGAPAEQVVDAVRVELTSMLRLRRCWYDESFAEAPGPYIERTGGISWGTVAWRSARVPMPSQEVTLTVEHDARPFGRFVLLAVPGERVTEDELVTAVALADQAGAALAAQGRLAS